MRGVGGSGGGGYVCEAITGVAHLLSAPGADVSSALNRAGDRGFPEPHQRYHSAMFILSGKREWCLAKAVRLMEVNIFPPGWYFVHSLTSIPSGKLEWFLAPVVRLVRAGTLLPEQYFHRSPMSVLSTPHKWYISGETV